MASTKSFTKEREARNLQRESWAVPLLARGLAATAQSEITTEVGGQVLTPGPVTRIDRARSVAVTKWSHMP